MHASNMHVCFYLQHVGYNTEAPHISVEGHIVKGDDLWSKKLRRSKIDLQLLPRFITKTFN